MNFKTRSLFAVLFAFLVVSVQAQQEAPSKRRSVTPRTPGPLVSAAVSGTVTDAVTGQPVRRAHVSGGRRSDQTTNEGKFEIRAAEGYGEILLEVDRSGYLPYRTKLSAGGPHVVTIQLQPTPTVTVRKTDGTSVQVDFESLKFGYGVPFSGYRASEAESFCFPGGAQADVHKAQLKRITGPAVATASSCCTGRDALKVMIEQKNGQLGEVYFVDSCETEYKQELISTDHVTGETLYIDFTEIAEVVFP